jgi:hypothetical protein
VVTRVWQKWRFSAPQTHLWLIKVWFSASTFVVKIATFTKPETVSWHNRRQTPNKKLAMGLDICHVTPSPKTSDTIEYFTLDEFQNYPDFIKKHKHLITQNDFGDKVIYYIVKGHHRKRVTDNFINGFKNDKLYFRLEDVKKAKSFLLANPGESQADIENTFQEKFIDNFIEGESVFFISH